MKCMLAICFACSMILWGCVAQEKGMNIGKMAKCFDLGVVVASTIGQKVVPTIKSLAACSKFQPMKTSGLDATAMLLLSYQFIQKIVGNQKCLLNTIQDTRNLLAPFAVTLNQLKCLSN